MEGLGGSERPLTALTLLRSWSRPNRNTDMTVRFTHSKRDGVAYILSCEIHI